MYTFYLCGLHTKYINITPKSKFNLLLSVYEHFSSDIAASFECTWPCWLYHGTKKRTQYYTYSCFTVTRRRVKWHVTRYVFIRVCLYFCFFGFCVVGAWGKINIRGDCGSNYLLLGGMTQMLWMAWTLILVDWPII